MIAWHELIESGALSSIDVHFARVVARVAEEPREPVLLAAAFASRHLREGHVCLPLEAFADRTLGDLALVTLEGERVPDLRFPPLDEWVNALETSPLVGGGNQRTPLVLSSGRLYLHRYYEHETRLARLLRERSKAPPFALDGAPTREGLERLFGAETPGIEDRQRRAAELALRRRLAIISGGPGTGKTSTVVRILALIVEHALREGNKPPRTLLLAPTGKAAARLVESIRGAKQKLRAEQEVIVGITESASTIHRALGVQRDHPGRYRHDAQRPLPFDVVLVDEASMVDLGLMHALVRAVPPAARLILLGDRHQLASVEAGSVLSELCAARGPVAESVIELTKSYRFSESSRVGRVARSVREGNAEAALSALDEPAELPTSEEGMVTYVDVTPGRVMPSELERRIVEGFRPYLAERDPVSALRRLGRFRVLGAHRRGYAGVEHLNREIERILRRAKLLSGDGLNYRGRPVMITRNDYASRLFNGDVGLIFPNERGELRAHFVDPDGTHRQLSVARLPTHETAFAMSVHKSQGSEHDEVVIVLPEATSPLLTRELLYTAVTRAKKSAHVFGPRAAVEAAVRRVVARSSGLTEALDVSAP